jgi:hypothetical protein
MTEQERIDTPLTREERLGGFLAHVRALTNAGLAPGFGRITREDENGTDYTFSLPNFMVRNAIDADPQSLTEAAAYFASCDTHPQGGDAEQGSVSDG